MPLDRQKKKSGERVGRHGIRNLQFNDANNRHSTNTRNALDEVAKLVKCQWLNGTNLKKEQFPANLRTSLKTRKHFEITGMNCD